MVSGTLAAAIFLAPELLKLLAPVPLLIAGRRRGVGAALRAAVVGALAVPILASFLALAGYGPGAAGAGLRFAVMVGVPAVLLERCLAWTKDARRGLEVAVTSYIAAIFVVLGLAGMTVEGGAGRLVAEGLDSALDQYAITLADLAGQSPEADEKIEYLKRNRTEIKFWGVRLFPALTAVLVVVGFWLNVMYARWFVGGETEKDDLTTWRLPPRAMPLLMAVMTGVVLQTGPIGGLLPRIDALLAGAAAGLLLLGVLYTLQGVAVVNWWFFRLRISPLLRMVGIGAQAVLLMPPSTVMFAVVGLTDAWFDLRKLDEQDDVQPGDER
jgi:hypothetical protein